MEKILSAKTKIRYEIQELNERLKQKKESIQVLKDHLEKLEDADVTDVENITWIDGLVSFLYNSAIKIGHLRSGNATMYSLPQ